MLWWRGWYLLFRILSWKRSKQYTMPLKWISRIRIIMFSDARIGASVTSVLMIPVRCWDVHACLHMTCVWFLCVYVCSFGWPFLSPFTLLLGLFMRATSSLLTHSFFCSIFRLPLLSPISMLFHHMQHSLLLKGGPPPVTNLLERPMPSSGGDGTQQPQQHPQPHRQQQQQQQHHE